MRYWSRLLLVPAALLGAACSDESMPTAVQPELPGGGSSVLLTCTVSARESSFRCATASATQAGGAGGPSRVVLGGQGTYVRLASGPVSSVAGVLSSDVTVQNLTSQALSTVDGTTAWPEGVRVFFHTLPTNGVTVANPDGSATFTATDQPFHRYAGALLGDGILSPQEVSSPKTWQFTLNGATDFTFTVLVSSAAPADNGVLRWTRVRGPLTSSYLVDVWGSGSSVVAVGGDGAIVRSADGGATWSTVTNPAAQTAFSLFGVWGSGSTVVAVGHAGTIVRSLDGGATWRQVPSGTTQRLYGVWGSGSVWVAVGTDGLGRRSTDGGATWSPTYIPTSHVIFDVWGSGSTLYAAGQAGQVFRSTDSGATWSMLYTAPGGTVSALLAIRASGDTIVAAGGFGAMLRSVDGGASWTRTTLASGAEIFSLWDTGNQLVAGTSGGVVLRSSDFGGSWTAVTAASPSGIWGSGSTLVAVGGPGGIIRSTDGGSSWAAVNTGSVGATLWGVWTSPTVAVAVGENGTITRSTDGGTTWADVASGVSSALYTVTGSGSNVVAAGRDGVILRSTDAGASWSRASSGTTGAFLSAWSQRDTIVLVGPGIVRSTDAGATWSPVPSPTVYGLHTVSGVDSVLFATAPNGPVIVSLDRGATWKLDTYSRSGESGFWSIFATPSQSRPDGASYTGVGERGLVGGRGWAVSGGSRSATTVTLRAIWGAATTPYASFSPPSTTTFYAVGDAGTIRRSTDGEYFREMTSGTNGALRGVWGNSDADVLVVGQGGVVLRGTR